MLVELVNTSDCESDGWTFGGCLRHKGEGLARDLYSKSLKVCIEYDGIWHFKDIYGQLNKKKYKDLLLEEWCSINNWRLLRIDEEIYNKDKKSSIDLIVNFVYNSTENLLKVGNRY